MLDSCESLNSPVSKTLLNCHRNSGKSDVETLSFCSIAKKSALVLIATVPGNLLGLISTAFWGMLKIDSRYCSYGSVILQNATILLLLMEVITSLLPESVFQVIRSYKEH